MGKIIQRLVHGLGVIAFIGIMGVILIGLVIAFLALLPLIAPLLVMAICMLIGLILLILVVIVIYLIGASTYNHNEDDNNIAYEPF